MAEIQKVTLGIYTCRACGSVDACSQEGHAGDGEERTPFVAIANTPGNIEAMREDTHKTLELRLVHLTLRPTADLYSDGFKEGVKTLLAVLGLTGGGE